MRIFRWRLKLAEHDYDVVYKTGKTNVNADALSRNPIEINCKAIINRKILNPNKPENADVISKLLEESEEEKEMEENEDFRRIIPIERRTIRNPILANTDNSFKENADSIPFTQEELNELSKNQIIEKALIYNPPVLQRIQTRSQTIKENDDHLKRSQTHSLINPETVEITDLSNGNS
ncbi:hypothetical protein P5V15_012811 [Pogonomyrmex californicus]